MDPSSCRLSKKSAKPTHGVPLDGNNLSLTDTFAIVIGARFEAVEPTTTWPCLVLQSDSSSLMAYIGSLV